MLLASFQHKICSVRINVTDKNSLIIGKKYSMLNVKQPSKQWFTSIDCHKNNNIKNDKRIENGKHLTGTIRLPLTLKLQK
jgi:hypothetical protein